MFGLTTVLGLLKLVKSVVPYQEFQKAEERLEQADMISPVELFDKRNRLPWIASRMPGKLDYASIAHDAPDIALTILHIEIKLALRSVARRCGFDSRHESVTQLLRRCVKMGVLSEEQSAALRNLVGFLSRAPQDSEMNTQVSQWALHVGPRLLAALDQISAPPDLSPFGL